MAELKITGKTLDDNFALQDFIDDFNSINNEFSNIVSVDINKFGVIGDNTTDITTPLKLAIAEVSASFNTNINSLYKKGGVVKLPKGAYKFSDTIRIPAYVTLQGEGPTIKWGYDLANPSGTILVYTGPVNKPAITFVGLTATGTPGTALIVNGSELDAGTYSQTYGAALKDISILGNSQEVGVVFSGCPESELENVSIQGFDFTLISSGHWGSKIENLFLRPLFCGYYGGNNVHNLRGGNFYIDKSGTKTSIASGHSCYNLINDVDLKYKNVDTGFISLRHYNLNGADIIVEHFTQAMQLSSDNANGSKLSNLWIEGNTRAIAIQYGIFKIECCYSYGSSIFIENYDGHLNLEEISGDYTTLYTTSYGSVSYENCSTNGDIRSSYDERLKLITNPEAWKDITLLNNWVNFDDASHTQGYPFAQYYKDGQGTVHFQGLIKGGIITGQTALFYLPVGYRPAYHQTFLVACNSAYATIEVRTNGDVLIQNVSNNTWLSLAGVNFRV